jgi:transcriptional regulator with XRE-family HTH domain
MDFREEKKRVAREFKDAIEGAGISQTSMAKRLNLSVPYLNRVLKGTQVPSDDLINEMSRLTTAIKASGLTATG